MHAVVAKTMTTSTAKNVGDSASEVGHRERMGDLLSGAAKTSADQDVTHRLRGISAL